MKKINIVLIILFLTIMIPDKAGITQAPEKEIKTGTVNVDLFAFPGNSYIGEIVISNIKEIKGDPAGAKDLIVYYNVGFDVNTVISVTTPGMSGSIQKNFHAKKDMLETRINLQKNDQRFIFLCMDQPGNLFISLDYKNKNYIVPLKAIVKNKANAALNKKYYAGLLREIQNHSYTVVLGDDELLYRIKLLESRAGLSDNINLDTRWRRPLGGGLLEMIELTSGAQAMEGSLQFSVMRDVSSKERQAKSINVSTLAQPQLKPHDFKKMLGGDKIKTTEIDKFAPFDSIYCRFSKIKHLFKCMDIARLIQEEIPVFTKFIDWKDDNQSKLMTKLGLKINPDLKKFYGIAIEEIAIVMADPYLIEGSDLAVIFHLNNKSLFTHQIKKYREAFLKEINNSEEGKVSYNNREITVLTSADNRLSSYSFIDGDYAVIATSAWMAKKCIDAKSGKAKSAADNLDFQYLMKQHNGPGDAFVYIGDDFVSRIISAPFKIGELRRVNCEANMKILKYACRLYSLENGGREPNIKDITDGGYMSNIPICPDDGSYDIALAYPRCKKHGVLGYLFPLSANNVTLADPDEAEKYKSFVDNYHNYWRKYVDPIGIRLDLGDTVSLRTIILPLIEHPDYNAIQDVFGGAPILLESLTIGNSSVIFHAAVKLKAFDNYKSDLSNLSDQRLKGFVYGAREEFSEKNPDFKGDPLAWIGNEADLFVVDEASMINNMIERRNSFDEMALINLLVLRIKVSDQELAKRALPAVTKLLGINLSISEKKYSGELLRMHLNRIPINILLREDGLWITLFEPNLARLAQSSSFFANISRSQGDKVTSLRDVTGIKYNKANFEIGIHPQNIKQLKKAINLMTHGIYRDYCGDNIRRLNLLVDLHEPFVRLSGPSGKDSSYDYKIGYSVRCPASGTYARNNEYYKCTFHDDPEDHGSASASIEKYMNAETNLSSVLHKLKSIIIDLGFTKEGLETQIFIGDPLK